MEISSVIGNTLFLLNSCFLSSRIWKIFHLRPAHISKCEY